MFTRKIPETSFFLLVSPHLNQFMTLEVHLGPPRRILTSMLGSFLQFYKDLNERMNISFLSVGD